MFSYLLWPSESLVKFFFFFAQVFKIYSAQVSEGILYFCFLRTFFALFYLKVSYALLIGTDLLKSSYK